MSRPPDAASASTFRGFRGGGVSGALIRSLDWSKTPLGPVERWPSALKAIVRAILHSPLPMDVYWGPTLIHIYNDGMLPILGEKHPAAMGQPAEACWPEVWSVIGPQLEGVRAQGQAIAFRDVMLPIVRDGRLGDAWWNYCYSPIFDDAGERHPGHRRRRHRDRPRPPDAGARAGRVGAAQSGAR